MAKLVFSQVVALVFICMVVNYLRYSAAIPCTDVNADLASCMRYIQSGDQVPPASCCNGLQQLKDSVKTTSDLQDVCKCAMDIVSRSNDTELAKAAQLPVLCKVSLSLPISRDTDCSKVKIA